MDNIFHQNKIQEVAITLCPILLNQENNNLEVKIPITGLHEYFSWNIMEANKYLRKSIPWKNVSSKTSSKKKPILFHPLLSKKARMSDSIKNRKDN